MLDITAIELLSLQSKPIVWRQDPEMTSNSIEPANTRIIANVYPGLIAPLDVVTLLPPLAWAASLRDGMRVLFR